MRITYHSDGAIFLEKSHSLQDLLEKFGMEDLNAAQVPFPPGLKLQTGTDEEVAAASHLPYQSLIGSLNWAAVSS